MTDTELIDLGQKHNVRIVRRPGEGGGWQWVAFNDRSTAVGSTWREVISECIKQSSHT